MNKADKQESDRRVAQISEWLLEGESTYKIIEYCRVEWGIKAAQVYKYIDKAKQLWDEIYKKDFANNLKWHLIARRKLYNKCIKESDKTNARQVLNDIADIQGIRELKVKHSGDPENPIIITEMTINRSNGEESNGNKGE